jgi:hypothetical protein
LDLARKETADLLRKHGGKTGEELKAEGKQILWGNVGQKTSTLKSLSVHHIN